jgi:hypothetical protein
LIIWLVGTDPPGRVVRSAGGELEATDEQREAHWTLDALTAAARERRIAVGRSQVRHILFAEGVRWRNPHPWGESHEIRSSSQKDEGRQPLRRGAQERHDHLPGRVRAGESSHLSSRVRLWSPEGYCIKAPLEYGRGTEKVWVYGALRVRDGKALTLSAPSRNTKGYLRLLEAVAQANPTGDLYLITDNLSSHKSPPIREWLENHPRVEQVFIPVGACWLKARPWV